MFEMEDLPYKPGLSDAELEERAKIERQEEAAAAKRKAARASSTKKRPQTAQRRKSTATKRASAVRTKKALPTYRLPGEQPRDRMGRFASKTGAVLKGAIFGTAHVVGGTVAAAQHGYKAVKGAHKRRKKAAGHGMTTLAGKPKRRRRKRAAAKPVVKQGFLGRIFGRKK